jgi:hypothetical protein
MTGSASDPADWQQHIRNKPRREALANRFRNAADPLRIVLVRDMWLTSDLEMNENHLDLTKHPKGILSIPKWNSNLTKRKAEGIK